MNGLSVKPYIKQTPTWPTDGRHILAHYDESTIVVYQAFQPEIAEYAAAHRYFGGEFSYSRMSWIKPNFLWMMYRCGWASKPGQEHVLAVRLPRTFFNELLHLAVGSTYDPAQYETKQAWQTALKNSDVRVQWDPDHDPAGKPLTRRAVQLGLRGDTLRRYGQSEVLGIEDITEFVKQQSMNAKAPFESLLMPEERVYSAI